MRSRLTRLVPWFALALIALPAAAQRGASAARPNIVLILMDDLGYGDLGSYGDPDAKTPHVDRLAREGVRLTDFYANGQTCSPTRTGLITGRYQQRYGIEFPLGALPGDSARGLLPSETSLPRLLKTAGYATGLVGKWHLGWLPQYRPRVHGFDDFWGFLSGFDDYFTHVGEFGRPDLFDNDSATTSTAYLTDEISARASAFIERHARGPFFIEVAYNATHWPYEAPNADRARLPAPTSREGTHADYVAMLERADAGIGRVLATLDRLGLARNTLVVFTNDNGGEWLSRNAPLFNRKATLWEGGIRVPAIFRWPGHLPAGTVSSQVGITMDLTASFVAAAGVNPPPSYRPEGMDLLPLLAEGRTVERTLYWRALPPWYAQRAVRRGRWKYLRDGVNEFIFDVVEDPGERHDLTGANRAMIAELRKLSQAWEKDVDASRAAASH